MEKSTQMGMNRTGKDASPIDSGAMLENVQRYSPAPRDGNPALAALNAPYIRAGSAVGSVPVPGTVKGALKSAAEKLTGHNPEVLINKLGERLAFERSGVRLYENFIRKCEALDGATPALPMKELREICQQEAEHFLLLKECIEGLGADPTAQTPDADVSGVAALGMQKVISDPRTSVSQCLEVLLSAELTDNAAWELLISLGEDMGLDEVMLDRFRGALQQESTHQLRVHRWYQEAVNSQLNKGKDHRG